MLYANEVRTYICICCPLGCAVEVTFDSKGSVAEVAGHSCERGRLYAIEESSAPVRTTTSFIFVEGYLEPLSVKTASPVPKDRIGDVLEAIKGCRLRSPVASGSVIIENVCGTGVDVIATKTIF